MIDKKSQNSQTLTVEKRKLELEISELRDGIDIKERKINVLQRKVILAASFAYPSFYALKLNS